jgi:dolichol-phosphate mannosyltransferase
MDADRQHDPAALPRMLEAIEAGAQLAIGCRYMPGGGTSNWGWLRRFQSRLATVLCRWAVGIRLHDPLSGYFMLPRADYLRIRDRLDGRGFKILLEIVAHLRPERVVEVPYTFRRRMAGRSKLTARVALDYLAQLRRLAKVNPRTTQPQPDFELAEARRASPEL